MTTLNLPAEWAKQDAILVTWPHQQTDWLRYLQKVEPVYIELVTTILQFQHVVIVCHNDGIQAHVARLLEQASASLLPFNVCFCISPCNDTWARDHGPICVKRDDQLIGLDFTFNGWGNKFAAQLDNRINLHLFEQPFVAAKREAKDFVLEGGAIESDGQGLILTTSHCVLNENRNPQFSREQIEDLLMQTLGAKKILWLDHGYLAGDDTDSHIDTLARFAPNNTIVYVRCDDETDEHFGELAQMEQELKQLRNLSNQPFELIPLPWPEAKYDGDGERLPATYANFLIINGAVLVPTYEDKNDEKALDAIQQAFPEHKIIAINCLPLIFQFGSLHCITMQLPAGFFRNEA